jgi:hypothetical protein
MLPDPRRSIVGAPDAILFLRISRVGVFQQPQALALIDRVVSVMAILRQLSGATVADRGTIQAGRFQETVSFDRFLRLMDLPILNERRRPMEHTLPLFTSPRQKDGFHHP